MRILVTLDRKHQGDNIICRWRVQAPKKVLLHSNTELNLKRSTEFAMQVLPSVYFNKL